MTNYIELYSKYQKLEKENQILRETLGYYANPDTWKGSQIEDYDVSLVGGDYARTVLGELYEKK